CVCPHPSSPVYQELCPGVLRSLPRSPGKPARNPAADDHVRCPYHRGCKPDARPAAAVGRRRRLPAVPAGRRPAADRSRYDVADHGRPVDSRPPRGAGNRCLFLHHARPALDLDAVAGAGAVREGLRDRRLERASGARRERDRCDLRAVRKIPEPALERKHHAGVRCRGAGIDRAASARPAACAGVSVPGAVGRRTGRSRGSARRAVIPAAAADGAVGQSAWRFCVRPSAGGAARARCGPERRAASAQIAGAAMGGALPLILEWRPADFGSIGALEVCLLLGIGLALWRGVKLPPLRIVLLLGLLHMALSQGRSGETLALLAPLILAAPLARQIGGAEVSNSGAAPPMRGVLFAGVAVLLAAGTLAFTSVHRFQPHASGSPVAAVAALKKLNLDRVVNHYDFGGYLIANGVAPFIDGR